MLISEERRGRERRERQRARINKRRVSKEDRQREDVYAASGDLFTDSRGRQSFVSYYYVLAVFLHWIYKMKYSCYPILVEKCAD